MLKSVSRNMGGGYRIQSYFPSTIPGNAIASSHLLPLYNSTPSSSQRYSYKPSSESENSVEYFRWPRAAVHSLIPLYKERQLKNHYSDWQRFLNCGHLTGRVAQTLGRRGLMWSNHGQKSLLVAVQSVKGGVKGHICFTKQFLLKVGWEILGWRLLKFWFFYVGSLLCALILFWNFNQNLVMTDLSTVCSI